MIDTYLGALRKTPLDYHTEMTGRAALETPLNAVIAAHGPKGASVTHEAKHLKGSAPDFKISVAGQIIAYVETKVVDSSFGALDTVAQVKRYRALCPNVILTDYLRFDLFSDKHPTETVRPGETSLLTGKPHMPQLGRATELVALLKRFLSAAPQGISRVQDLALELQGRVVAHLRGHVGRSGLRISDCRLHCRSPTSMRRVLKRGV